MWKKEFAFLYKPRASLIVVAFVYTILGSFEDYSKVGSNVLRHNFDVVVDWNVNIIEGNDNLQD